MPDEPSVKEQQQQQQQEDQQHDAVLAPLHSKRVTLRNALPPALCSQLSAIVAAVGVVGYRPAVRSLTLHDLVAHAPELLPPLLAARHAVWSAVEDAFGLQCCTWPETTSLIAWDAGASLGWHHDSNAPHLVARHLAAVAYCSSQGADFDGGCFCFQDGAPPLRVAPGAGQLLAFTADASNTHCVEAVTRGQRVALTLWFTLAGEHQEDAKVLSRLDGRGAGLPETMWQQGGHDVRLAQLRELLGVTVRPVDAPTLQQHHQQPHVVECCLQGCSRCSSSNGQGAATQFASLQEAILGLHLLHRQRHADCRSQGSSSNHITPEQLPEALRLAQQLMQQGARQLEALVPRWRALGVLVPDDELAAGVTV